jgi:hypothetical protein
MKWLNPEVTHGQEEDIYRNAHNNEKGFFFFKHNIFSLSPAGWSPWLGSKAMEKRP